MDIYKLKFTRLQMEIFRLFCVKTGSSLNQSQIAKLLKVTPTAVAKALKSLEKEQIVKIAKGTTNLNIVELNRDSKKTLEFKRAENLKLLYESGLPEYLEEELPGCTIIIFGSYAKGDDTIKSDIDIAVIGVDRSAIKLDQFEKILEKPIRINYYRDFNKINKYLKSNILNGITISGGVEL